MHSLKRFLIIAAIIFATVLLAYASLPLVQTGTWVSGPSMVEARDGAASVLLKDGNILITGGTSSAVSSQTVEMLRVDGSMSAAASMLTARTHHTATELGDDVGRVLVVGGDTGDSVATGKAEIFDPTTNTWTEVGSLQYARSGHTATPLYDGRVLIAGGENGGVAVPQLEIYDPTTRVFSSSGSLMLARKGHAATVLDDFRVLIIGGFGVDNSGNTIALNAVEIFNPADNSVQVLGASLNVARGGITATKVIRGNIIVAGGNDGQNDLASIEIYDAVTQQWKLSAASLANARTDHDASLLPYSHGVLFTGGTTNGTAQAIAEIYRPWNDDVVPAGIMTAQRLLATSLPLGSGAPGPSLATDGLFFVAGGSGQTTTEFFRFATIKTDKADYSPGSPVLISGTGYMPGETVRLQVHKELNGTATDSEFVVQADGSGNISYDQFALSADDGGARVELTAAGVQSGDQAQTVFRDAVKIWKGCANDGNWQNRNNWTWDKYAVCRWGMPTGAIIPIPEYSDPPVYGDVAEIHVASSYPDIWYTVEVSLLTINDGAGVTVSTSGYLKVLSAGNCDYAYSGLRVDGHLFINGGMVTTSGNLSGDGAVHLSDPGLLRIGCSLTVPGSNFFATGGTVEFLTSGSTSRQFLQVGAAGIHFFNLTVSGSGNANLGGVDELYGYRTTKLFVGGDLTINNSNPANFSWSTVTLDGSGPQVIGGTSSPILNDLIVNNPAGVTLGTNITVDQFLTFTRGKIFTQANTLKVKVGWVLGGGQDTGYVVGSLAKDLTADAGRYSRIFEVGTAAYYTPLSVDIDIPSAQSGAFLAVRAVEGEHFAIGSSGVDPNRNVNNYWSVSGANVTGYLYGIWGNFSGSRDGQADPMTFMMTRYNSGTWYPMKATRWYDTATYSTPVTVPSDIATAFGDFVIGNMLPAPTIGSKPANPTNQTSAVFTFSDAVAGVSFECSLDGAGFAACSSGQSYSGLADGTHTFAVKAKGALGVESATTSYTWTVDTIAPPAPTIDTTPNNSTNNRTAVFGFSDTEAGVSFQCSRDGGAFAACSSGQNYSVLADGSHTFSVKAQDAAGNQSEATSYTWMIDATPPPVPTIGDKPADPTNQTSAVFSFSDAEAEVSYMCRLDGAAFAVCDSGHSYSGLGEASHTFWVKARDAVGNESAAASYTWRIDITPPTFFGPMSDLVMEATGPDGAILTLGPLGGEPVAVDYVPGVLFGVFIPATCTPSFGSIVPLGATTVTCEATDAAGNKVTASLTATVTDTTAPVIGGAPESLIVEASGPNGAAAAFVAPNATDIVDGTLVASCTPAPGSTFPLGTTLVNCSATDAHSNTAATSFTVTVQDTTPPRLTLPSALTAEATGGSGATVTFNTSAADLVDGAVNVSCDHASGSAFALGATTVNCSATDAHGNTASASLNITVQDTTAPQLTLPPAITAEATGGSGATVTFNTSAADLVDGAVNVSCDHASGSAFPLGTSAVHCSATDAHGNKATGSFNVTIQDTTPPQLTLPAPITAEATGPSGANVTYSTSAADLVDGVVAVTCSSVSGALFPFGTTTVSCSATDSHNNKAEGVFTIKVQDTIAPVINVVAPKNTTYLLNQAVATAYSCSDSGSGVAACDGTAPVGGNLDTSSVGSKTFTVTATDKQGNSVTQTITYQVGYNLCLLYDPTRAAKSGSTIPLKLQLCDANRNDVSASNVVVHATALAMASTDASYVVEDPGYANPDDNFRFDASLGPTGGYIFNLSTKGLSTGTYVLTITAGADSKMYPLQFQVR